MPVRTKAFAAIIVSAAWLAWVQPAHACSCVRSDASQVCSAMTPDAAIFTGTAVSSEPATDSSGAAMRRYTFQVGESFHGLDRTVSTIQVTVDDHTSCAMGFEIGAQYLVYAGRTAGGLETSPCMRTRGVADARADLDALRDIVSGANGGRLTGRVFDAPTPLDRPGRPISFSGTGVAGIDVVVSGPGGQYQTSSDADGWFTLTGLPPGRYRVQVRPPANRVATRDTAEAVVARCSRDVIFLTSARSFEGTVVDDEGRPARAGIRLSLVADGSGEPVAIAPRAWGTTDALGHVTLSGVPPGRYRFGVSVAEPPSSSAPYPPTWYGEAGGVLLEISDQQTTRVVMRLPRRLPLRTISGSVTDAAGRTPSGNPVVYVFDQDGGEFHVTTARVVDGRFTFEGVAGRRYSFQASQNGSDRSVRVDESPDLTQPIALVLPR